MKNLKRLLKKYDVELIIFFLALAFSTWLMFSTFSYQNGEMQIASKAWSDFASHIPLIRSFSFGDNFPPEYPLFSGPPIRYHFLFYALVGLLEKGGLRIDFALNILSILGFSLLILMIYLFSKEIFKSKAVGILSIIFFLFNGSLGFIKFFSAFPLSKNSLFEIISNNKFISFGPYDGSIISAFWNLNIYTNQRHLALSYGLSLLLIYLFLKYKEDEKKENIKKSVFIGIVLGFSFILNMSVFLMTVVILFSMFLFFGKKRIYIFTALIIGGLITLPQYLYIQSGGNSSFQIFLYFGYLVSRGSNFFEFINYWFQNLGLHFFLIPLGFFIASKNNKKILISFFSLFLIGNLFQFSPEIAANHKFFNYFIIIGSMFSAYALYFLWKKIVFRPLVLILFFLLIFSGIIDFFPIKNDTKIALSDYPVNKDIVWIMQNTKPNSVFLNTQYLYDNASLAGRKIFLGWPYFAWSQGYDTNSRDELRKTMLNTKDLNYFCKNVRQNNLSYAELSPTEDITVNKDFFEKKFISVYKNSQTDVSIYSLSVGCKK
ncbi:MAG: hypothetical protein AAB702_02240 [Patescibacteria group bacterium]